MRSGILIPAVAVSTVLLGSTVVHGQSSPRPDVVSVEVEATTRAELQRPPAPIIDIDTDFDDELPSPSAETEAEVGGMFSDPRVNSRASCDWWLPGSTNLIFDASFDFLIEDRRLGTSTRVASGSWSTSLVIDLDRHSNLHLSVRPGLFDDITYNAYVPGTLTGPDGVIVSGPPPGEPISWTWIIDLAPGRYTFEALADYEAIIDDESSLSDRASHDVTLSFRPARCRADLDVDGELTLFDFLQFQNYFDAASPLADFDDDGELTIFDFLAFQNAFDAGCG